MSYVPDTPYLYDKLTGREFLQFIADMYGLPAAVARERIARRGSQRFVTNSLITWPRAIRTA